MIDDVDIAQSRLTGKCEICKRDLPMHKMHCPRLKQNYGQFGITSPEQFEQFQNGRTIHHQLDLFEDN